MSEAADDRALILQVSADNTKMLRAFEAAVSKIDKYSDTMERRAKKAASSMEESFAAPNLGKALGKVFDSARFTVLEEGSARLRIFGGALEPLGAFGIAAAAGVAAFALSMERTETAVKFASNIDVLSKSIGVSTDFIQEFNFAASQSDVDVGAADKALKTFNESLGAVQKNLPRARQLAVVFGQALKLTPEQLRGYKDVGELLPVIADRIKNAGSAAEQAAIAKKLGLEELLPLLKEGAAGFDELTQKARDLGIVMDAATVQKAAEAEKKLKELDEVMKAKSNVTFAQFADTLIFVKQAFLDAETAVLGFLAAITNTESAETKIAHLRDSIATLKAQGRDKEPVGAGLIKTQQAELNKLELADINAQLKAADKARPGPAVTPPIAGAAKGAKSDPTLGFDKAAQDAYAAGLKALTTAQAALLIDVQQRATAEKAAVFHDLASKISDLDVEEAKIRTAKNNSHKASQLALIETAKSDQINAAHAKAEEIDRQTAETLRRQAQEYAAQDLDGQAQLLQLQQGLTFSDTLRQKYALQLVDLVYQRTQLELEGIIASKTATAADKRLAQLKLDQLRAQHPLEVEAAQRGGSQGAQSATSIVAGIKQQDGRVEQERNAYAEIDRLRQADKISEAEAQQAKFAVAAQYNQQRLTQASEFFGNLATLSGSSNKTLAAIGKAAAIAQATIDGVVAVQKALASAPPPFNFAIAAAVGVAAAVNVAKIAGFEGGGYTGDGDRKRVAGVVHGEEFVVNAPATARNRPLLDYINRGGDLRGLLPAPNVAAVTATPGAAPPAGGDVHLHYGPQLHYNEPNVVRAIERQGREFRTVLQNWIRNGDLQGASS